jgi:hypothetical protein
MWELKDYLIVRWIRGIGPVHRVWRRQKPDGTWEYKAYEESFEEWAERQW